MSPYRGPDATRTGHAPTAATTPTLTNTAPSAAIGAPSPIAIEAEVGGIVLITDRGIEHAGNEDAAAAGTVAGEPHRAGFDRRCRV